jgi:hypothetical protein
VPSRPYAPHIYAKYQFGKSCWYLVNAKAYFISGAESSFWFYLLSRRPAVAQNPVSMLSFKLSYETKRQLRLFGAEIPSLLPKFALITHIYRTQLLHQLGRLQRPSPPVKHKRRKNNKPLIVMHR